MSGLLRFIVVFRALVPRANWALYLDSYFGHGGAEQYVRAHKIRHLPRCAATMLWGCSSGTLKYMGEFDRTGTPYNYMLAGWSVLRASPAVLESLLSNRLPTCTAQRSSRTCGT